MFAQGGVINPSIKDQIQMNHRMVLTAGPLGLMHMSMGEHESMPMMKEHEAITIPNLGLTSLGSSLLQQHRGSQVFQFPIPLAYTHGSDLKVSFTYCQNGIDCDTEWVSLKSMVQQPIMKAALSCPAINWKHELSCATGKCLLNFINLTPNINVDWVDVHFRSNAPVLLQSFGLPTTTTNIPVTSIPQLNWRMKLAAGPKGAMMMDHMDMSNPQVHPTMAPMTEPVESELITQLGLSTPLASSLKSQFNANQVFQFPIPLAFTAGTAAQVSFTYCLNGLDCDTEWLSLSPVKSQVPVKKELSQVGIESQEAELPIQQELPIKQTPVLPKQAPILPKQEAVSLEQPLEEVEPVEQSLNPAENLSAESEELEEELKLSVPNVNPQPSLPQSQPFHPRQQQQQVPIKFGLGQQRTQFQQPNIPSNLVGLSNAELLQQPIQFGIQHPNKWLQEQQHQLNQQLLQQQQFLSSMDGAASNDLFQHSFHASMM